MLSLQEIEATIPPATAAFTPDFIKVQKYLADRGITTSTIDKAGIIICQLKPIFNSVYRNTPFDNRREDRLAIVFRHFDVSGETIPWWSARLIEPTPSQIPRGKMFCPPGEPPHGYLAPLTSFKSLKSGDSVYIHESCIKALSSSRLGYHSVGLNGVYGFSSRKHRIELIEELRSLPWKPLNLHAKIVFDSNAADNPDIQHAISTLSERIYRLCGVRSTHLLLPKSDADSHWGFDDFAHTLGDKAAKEFLEQEGIEVDIGEVEFLKVKLNSEVVVVKSLGRIAEQETGTLMSRQVFTDVNYAHYTAKVEDGEKVTQVNVPRMWLSDSRRTVVDTLEYMPGKPRINGSSLNLWRSMGIEPQTGDIQPFFELLVNNVGDQNAVRWMFQWMAYPLQNLGAKLNTYIHLFGPSGTGKNMVLRPLERIYGKNFVTIAKDNLSSNFNSVYAAKQFIHIDELHGDGHTDKLVAQKIKMIVTGESTVVNMKGQPEYSISNHANLMTTSNYYDSVKLDSDDRRAFVVKFENIDDKRGDQEYWMEYVEWCDGGGAESLYQYLLDYNLDGFDPKGWALATKWKSEVTDASRSPVEQWVQELLENSEAAVPMNYMNRCVFTAKELATLFYSKGADDLTPGQIQAVGKAMRNAGFEMANAGGPVKSKGALARYWVVCKRDQEWGHSECVANLV